jgi:hypothetical protein
LSGWFLTTDELVSLGNVPWLNTITLSDDNDIDSNQTLKLSRILANSTALTDLRLNFGGMNVSVVFYASSIYSVCVFKLTTHLATDLGSTRNHNKTSDICVQQAQESKDP